MSPFNKKFRFKVLFFCLLLGFPAAATLFAAVGGKDDYNIYIPQLAYTSHPSIVRDVAANFLTYPFELIRWPLNRTIDFVEDKRIPQKTRFVLEKMEDYGITPEIGLQVWGGEVNFPHLMRFENQLPENAMAKGWLYYAPELTFKTGVKTGIEPADGEGFHLFGLMDYEKRSEEFFYGIGPDTSTGEGTSYKSETTTLEAHTGYTLENNWRLDSRFAYRNINIDEGTKDGRGIISPQVFPNQTIPGLDGDDILTLGTEISWEPEKNRRAVSLPSKAKFGFDYNEGVQGSEARYLKFTTELAKNFDLGSHREFSAHFYGEHNNSFNGGDPPFHQMPRLGGFGGFPYNSYTHRAYVRGRFTDQTALLFNFEYRYRIYTYRNWTMSHAFFLDEGQTFKKFSRFQFKDFKESYGTGFRLGYKERMIFDFEVAHADEGTTFYFKNRRPF